MLTKDIGLQYSYSASKNASSLSIFSRHLTRNRNIIEFQYGKLSTGR